MRALSVQGRLSSCSLYNLLHGAAKGSVEVYATDGDDSLGGSDLDLCLHRIIEDRISTQAQTLRDVVTAAPPLGGQVDYDEQCSLASLRTKAEDIKKKLTYATSVPFSCTMAEVRQQRRLLVCSSNFNRVGDVTDRGGGQVRGIQRGLRDRVRGLVRSMHAASQSTTSGLK